VSDAASPELDVPKRRPWIVLLYFSLAALVGLGFVITGATMALFGAKEALFPGLGLTESDYKHRAPADIRGFPREPSEAELSKARKEALEDRRQDGAEGVVSGLIVAGVGAPVMVWHLKRGRLSGAAGD
jgi:hypothetical protein